jgi:hypothetical protein
MITIIDIASGELIYENRGKSELSGKATDRQAEMTLPVPALQEVSREAQPVRRELPPELASEPVEEFLRRI